MVTVAVYLFEVFRFGLGVVVFTYFDEAFPLHIHEVGVLFAIATT